MPALNYDLTDQCHIERAKFWQGTHHVVLLSGNSGTKTTAIAALLQNEVTDAPYTRVSFTISEEATYDAVNDYARFPSAPYTVEVVNTDPTLPIQFRQVVLMKGASPNRPRQLAPANINAGTNTISATAHGLAEGDAIAFSIAPGGVLPAPLAAGTLYKAISVATDTFIPSLDGVAQVNLTDAGTGNFYLIFCKGIRVAIASQVSTVTINPGQSNNFTFNPLTFEHEL